MHHPFATIKAVADQPRSVINQILLPKPGEESCEPTLDLFFGFRFQHARIAVVARGGDTPHGGGRSRCNTEDRAGT
jgi:hypothetical protein